MEIAAVAVSATDLARSAAFYELLGFSFQPIEGGTVHLESPGAVRLMIDAAAAGHTVVHEPFDAPWGQRYATVADPDGYRVDVFCPLPGAGGTW